MRSDRVLGISLALSGCSRAWRAPGGSPLLVVKACVDMMGVVHNSRPNEALVSILCMLAQSD